MRRSISLASFAFVAVALTLAVARVALAQAPATRHTVLSLDAMGPVTLSPGTTQQLSGTTRDRVTLARDAGDLGTIHLHVPRVGYVLSRG